MTIKEIVGEENYDVNKIKSWFCIDMNNDAYDPLYEVFGIDDLYIDIPLSCKKDIVAGIDRLRKENGELPLFYNDEDPNEIDDDSWYEMRIAVLLGDIVEG